MTLRGDPRTQAWVTSLRQTSLPDPGREAALQDAPCSDEMSRSLFVSHPCSPELDSGAPLEWVLIWEKGQQVWGQEIGPMWTASLQNTGSLMNSSLAGVLRKWPFPGVLRLQWCLTGHLTMSVGWQTWETQGHWWHNVFRLSLHHGGWIMLFTAYARAESSHDNPWETSLGYS